MAERIYRRKSGLVVGGTATLLTMAAAIAAACGGGGNDGEVKDTATGTPFGTPANSGGSGESPTAVSSTVKPPEATATATATTTASATPEPTITPEPTEEVDELEVVNQSIVYIENLNPEGAIELSWQNRKRVILEGIEGQGGHYGLYDMRQALEAGDIILANQIFSQELFKKITDPVPEEAHLVWDQQKIGEVDPDRIFIARVFLGCGVGVSRELVAIDLLKVKYALIR